MRRLADLAGALLALGVTLNLTVRYRPAYWRGYLDGVRSCSPWQIGGRLHD